jgi:hypothetical protein
MIDTLETAWQFGLRLAPRVDQDEDLAAQVTFDPFACKDFQTLVDCWFPLTVALNSLNRSMGKADAYPFVLMPAMTDKLRLVHLIIRDPPTPTGE